MSDASNTTLDLAQVESLGDVGEGDLAWLQHFGLFYMWHL
jgi:hypothetical protein